MEPINFVYWLQGHLEITNQKGMTEEQVEKVRDHIKLVLEKVTPEKTERADKAKEYLRRLTKVPGSILPAGRPGSTRYC